MSGSYRLQAVQAGVTFASGVAPGLISVRDLDSAGKIGMLTMVALRTVELAILVRYPAWQRVADGMCLGLWVVLIAWEASIALRMAPLPPIAVRLLHLKLTYVLLTQEALNQVGCGSSVTHAHNA